MKKFLGVIIVGVLVVALAGFASGPVTKTNATLGTGGETIKVTPGDYPVNVTAYVKCNTGTITVAGFDKGVRAMPEDPYGDDYATVDSLVTVAEGDIIPIVGKFTDLYWKGVGVSADGSIYIYKD